MAKKQAAGTKSADPGQSFREYGSIRGLFSLLEQEKTSENEKEIRRLTELFRSFEYAYGTGSVAYLQETVRRIGAVAKAEEPLSEDAKKRLQELCVCIQESFSAEEHPDYPETCFLLKAAETYLGQERLSLAASMAQESVTTYLIERFLQKYLSEIAVLDAAADYFMFLHTPAYREAVRSWYTAGFEKELPQQWTRFERLYSKIRNAVFPETAPVPDKKKITSSEDLANWITQVCAMLREDMDRTLSEFYRVKSSLNRVRSSYLSDQTFDSFWAYRDGSWPVADMEEELFREEMNRYRSLSGRSTFLRPLLPAYRREEVQELHRELVSLKKLEHSEVTVTFLNRNPAVCAIARLGALSRGQDVNDVEAQLAFLNGGKDSAYASARDFIVGYDREIAWYELWKVLNAKVEQDAQDGKKARLAGAGQARKSDGEGKSAGKSKKSRKSGKK